MPPSLREVAVLMEPLTVAEKSLIQIWHIQRRLHWECPVVKGLAPGHCHKAVVLGAGPIGILGAMAFKVAGFETYVYSRSKAPNPKAELVESFGVKYISSEETPPEELARQLGNIDVVYEAVGGAKISFEVLKVLGLNGTPLAGDDFVVAENESRARDIADFRQRRRRDANAASGARGTLEQMFSQIAAGVAKELPVIVKSDVQGSLEAIAGSLEKLSTDEVSVRVLHAAVGGINESDVILAKASSAFIIGFNVRANPQARDLARRDGVEVRYYSIIYDLIEDMRGALSGLLAPTLRERFLGNASIRDVFNITKVGKVAGCMVTEGTVRRGARVRLLRDNVVVHEGTLKTLKRFKEEVREVNQGYECGMAFENYQDIQPGDVIECFEVEEVARAL